MHIIIDATTTQDQMAYAGPGRYTRNIILSLVKEYPDTKYSILLFEDKESTLDTEISKYPNAQIIRIGKYKDNDYKNDITYLTQILPAIKKIKQKDSIYFCPYFWRNFPSYTMPVVLFIHDMNLPMFNMYSQQSPIHNFIRKIQYWMTLNKAMKCKHIITNSQNTKTDFLKYYPKYPSEKISVSYIGVEIEEKETSLDNILPKDWKEKKYLIYLGAGINRTKNSKGALLSYVSFLKTLDKEQAPYFVIAGGKFEDKTKPEIKELYDIIEKNNIQDKVIFTGFYKDEDKYSLLHNSFAFIHLSLAEGFGIAPIEAMRSKTPTILHRSPVYLELFSDVSVMVDGNNPGLVGCVIKDIYMNEDKYKELVEKAYTLSKEYTWEKSAEITHGVFEKI
ncbi:MAG TPA: glycosyltransferase family 1 protein [Candidatus Dojkabacteria bacterium]|nr:glycosyltransferase family 1 protein [Candidatus Dojkabacteria bacterium]